MPFVFSTFFEWWYDSGTPEVRLRYADHFFIQLMISIISFMITSSNNYSKQHVAINMLLSSSYHCSINSVTRRPLSMTRHRQHVS